MSHVTIYIHCYKTIQISRYAMTSSISPLASSEDPCHGVDCGEAGLCLGTVQKLNQINNIDIKLVKFLHLNVL